MLRDHHGRRKGCNGRQQARRGLARVLVEKLIHDNDGCHSFDDGDGTRHDTRIMTASGGQSPWSSIILSGVLRQ
jgi:hypothetical protein